MAVDQTPTQTSEPFLKGSLIWRKMGPLPVWAWALIVLGVALAWVSWRRNRAAGNEAATGYTDELPGNQSAPAIFVVPQVTVPSAPPAGASMSDFRSANAAARFARRARNRAAPCRNNAISA